MNYCFLSHGLLRTSGRKVNFAMMWRIVFVEVCSSVARYGSNRRETKVKVVVREGKTFTEVIIDLVKITACNISNYSTFENYKYAINVYCKIL